MACLPSLLVLQSGGKYLSVTENVPANLPSGFVKFDDEPIYSPRVKFAVEVANIGDGRFVHIRSCYNNKYLVIQKIEGDSWIVASAKKTEEDDSNDSCTLFEAYSLEADQKSTTAVEGAASLELGDEKTTTAVEVDFLELGDEKTTTAVEGAASLDLGDVKTLMEGDEATSELEAGYETTSVRIRPVLKSATASCLSCDGDTHQGMRVSSVESVFNVINWRSVLILPTFIAIRSEHRDNNFLQPVVTRIIAGLIPSFTTLTIQTCRESGLDIGDQRVSNQLTQNRHGDYYIWDSFANNWWRHRGGMIVCEPYDRSPREYLFRFVRLQDRTFAVRSLGGNNNFCGPFTQGRHIDDLSARFPSISRETRITIEEVVLRREISNIEYRLNDSRIYDEQVLEMSHAYGTNDTPVENDMTHTFSITYSRSTSWNNSVSVSFGVTVSLEVALVPSIVTGRIEISTETVASQSWGGSHTTETTRQVDFLARISPNTRVRVAMMVSRARYDVPFSYTQRDQLTSGEWVETRKHDGIFVGMNSFNFHVRSTVVPPN